MYVIFVKAPITNWYSESGFFTNCYQSSITGDDLIYVLYEGALNELDNPLAYKEEQ